MYWTSPTIKKIIIEWPTHRFRMLNLPSIRNNYCKSKWRLEISFHSEKEERINRLKLLKHHQHCSWTLQLTKQINYFFFNNSRYLHQWQYQTTLTCYRRIIIVRSHTQYNKIVCELTIIQVKTDICSWIQTCCRTTAWTSLLRNKLQFQCLHPQMLSPIMRHMKIALIKREIFWSMRISPKHSLWKSNLKNKNSNSFWKYKCNKLHSENNNKNLRYWWKIRSWSRITKDTSSRSWESRIKRWWKRKGGKKRIGKNKRNTSGHWKRLKRKLLIQERKIM